MFSKKPRCQIVPLPGQQVTIGIDGRERLRWHAANDAPRPFFFPLIGPSGLPLTRMGHPGAANHDHHRSVWFAHHKVLGIDFWGDNSEAVIRQQEWLAYEDGDASPWIDYSGSIDVGITEGITYFDHPSNNSFPSKWHVRDDGWMGASVCRDGPVMLTRTKPITWRYLLHAHPGNIDLVAAEEIAKQFHSRAKLDVRKSSKPHHTATILRAS